MASASKLFVLAALLPCCVADIAALGRASKAVQDGLNEVSLASATKTLKRAEEACSADASGAAEERVISNVRKGYEALLVHLAAPAVDVKKLQKTIESKRKKKDAAAAEANDDEELVSKSEKAERAAKLEKAQSALAAAESKLAAAEAAAKAKEPRPANLFPRLSTIASRISESLGGAGTVQVLSEAPMVVQVDDWLGEAGMAALAQLPAAFDTAFPSVLEEGGGEPDQLLLPTNATQLGEASAYSADGPSKPTLCLPTMEDGETATQEALQQVDDVITRAKHSLKAGTDGCDATAGLVEEVRDMDRTSPSLAPHRIPLAPVRGCAHPSLRCATIRPQAPPDWDAGEDGQWVGSFMSAADRYGPARHTSRQADPTHTTCLRLNSHLKSTPNIHTYTYIHLPPCLHAHTSHSHRFWQVQIEGVRPAHARPRRRLRPLGCRVDHYIHTDGR
jgi:hypothetical protein